MKKVQFTGGKLWITEFFTEITVPLYKLTDNSYQFVISFLVKHSFSVQNLM